MENQSGSKARVGFVIFIGMVLVMGAVYLVGDGGGIFREYTTYYARFPSTTGLRPDARVYVSGVLAGKVEEIGFSKDLDERKIEVKLLVQSRFEERIREDSFAWIQSEGLLGDKSVGIMIGDPVQPRLQERGIIEFKDRSLIQEFVGEELVSGTSDLLANIIALLKEINAGRGTMGQLLRSPDLYDNLNNFTKSLAATSDELAGITRDMKSIIAEVREQKGALGKLIFSEEYAGELTQALQSVNRIMAAVDKTLETISRGEGTLGKLVQDDRLYRSVEGGIARLSSVTERLEGSLRAMDENRSALGRLITDRELGERFQSLVANLERGTGLLEKILSKVESGEGSLGMLVQDPSIAAGLRDILLGIQESNLLVSVVRQAEETGRAIRFRDQRLDARAVHEQVERIRAGKEREPESRPLPATVPEGESQPVPAPGSPAPPAESDEKKEGTEPRGAAEPQRGGPAQ